MNNKEIVLGLDVSTACIGCCIYLNDKNEEYGKIIELTHIVPKVSGKIKGIESLFLKKQIFDKDFLTKWKDFGIQRVVIEEPLLNSNNVNTVATLLRFNGMISDCVYNTLGIVPEYISSYDARKYSFPELMAIRKFNKQGDRYDDSKIIKDIKKDHLVLFGAYSFDVDKKEIMMNYTSEVFKDINWIYDKHDKLKKENFDANDALVACLGFCNKNKYGDLEPKIDNINKENNRITYNVNFWNKVNKQFITLDELN